MLPDLGERIKKSFIFLNVLSNPLCAWIYVSRAIGNMQHPLPEHIQAVGLKRVPCNNALWNDKHVRKEGQKYCWNRSKVLRSLRYYLRAQSHGHHTTDCLEESGTERRSSLTGRKRPLIVKHWNCFKGNVRETSEMVCSVYGLFQAHRIRFFHLEETKLNVPQ